MKEHWFESGVSKQIQIYRVNATATDLVIIKEPAATALQIIQISQYLLP